MGRMDHQPLTEQDRRALAEALPDTPENVIARHVLGRGSCKAWVLGPINHFRAAIVQYDFLPAEPTGFGDDARGIVELLGSVEGWECVFLRSVPARAVAAIIERETGVASRLYGECLLVLAESVACRTSTSRQARPSNPPPDESGSGGVSARRCRRRTC